MPREDTGFVDEVNMYTRISRILTISTLSLKRKSPSMATHPLVLSRYLL